MKKTTTDISKPKIIGFGVIISALISIAFIFVFALVLTTTNLNPQMALPLSSVSLGIGSFFGGKYSAKKIGEKGYLWGLIIGLLTFFINLLVSLIFNASEITLFSFIRFIIILIMSMLGGIIGINSKSNNSLVK